MSGEGDPNTQTPMETDQDELKKCRRCKQTFEQSVLEVFVSEVNIEELLSSEQPKGRKPTKDEQDHNDIIKTKREEFKKLFCALLNCVDHTAVIFHVEDTRILDKHDIEWNNELMQFVPDNSCYHDVFERVILDEQHFRVRVKPRKDTELGVMSTFCFHSSLSLDKGLDTHPSHHQMQRVLENARDGHGYSNEPLKLNLPDDTSFQEGQVVQVRGDPGGTVPFQECMWLQAKRIAKPRLTPNELVGMMWGPKEDNKHDLGKYISAFSKVPRGGIIYFGILEKPEGDKKSKLKSFSSEGVVFDQQNSDQLKQYFNKEIQNLLWVRAQSANDQSENIPVVGGSVEVFRFPEEPQSRCIIKITVYQFQGVCFFRKDGPESYVLNAEDKPVLVEGWAEWAEGSHCKDFVSVNVQFN